MPTPRRTALCVWGVAAVATSAIMMPLWRPGYLLYRDAVSTPRTFLTDTMLGIGANPPRAVPQDGLIAVLTSAFDGGAVVVAILTIALLLGGVGYGLLAARLVPQSGSAGAGAAALLSVWNPFVAERLLQGHWSLFTAYASLGWILLAALRIHRRDDTARTWSALVAAALAAALTPSGLLIASVTVIAAVTIPLAGGRRWTASALSIAPLVIGALPIVAAALGGSSTVTASGVSVQHFTLRPEPGLGRLLTSVSLGGIWNADAVPASRQSGWAVVASVLFITVVGVGLRRLWVVRRESTCPHGRRVVAVAAALAAISMGFILLASSTVGLRALSWLNESVGGAGLLRDTTKFAMLAVPLMTIAVAACVVVVRRWVPSGFAFAAAVLLIVAPLPDLAWGIGGRIAPIDYPAEWQSIAERIRPDDGAVALWPGDTVRRFDFTTGPSLDPTARMVRATVVESGALTVDGVVVDPSSTWATRVHRALASGDDVRPLGVGWVLASQPVPGFGHRTPTFRGPTLTLYRIDGPRTADGPTSAQRTTAVAALWIWLITLAGAVVTAAVGAVRAAAAARRPARRPK